ncbi:hypothetical protein RUM43_004638 [Polyplax serrata]|uniref:Uncharacterized protein n=1 Tax=Polyplax serrata TaxID=468196 RepID=A0AAN8XM87_POLSC
MGIRLFNFVIINEKTTLTGSFPSSHSDDTVNKECHTAACTLQSDDTLNQAMEVQQFDIEKTISFNRSSGGQEPVYQGRIIKRLAGTNRKYSSVNKTQKNFFNTKNCNK